MFKMIYESDCDTILPKTIEKNMGDDCTLTELFANFVDMTRMVGYHKGSWERLIDDLYGFIVLKIDAPENYNIYQWIYEWSVE